MSASRPVRCIPGDVSSNLNNTVKVTVKTAKVYKSVILPVVLWLLDGTTYSGGRT
jgi:hypothetical protein